MLQEAPPDAIEVSRTRSGRLLHAQVCELCVEAAPVAHVGVARDVPELGEAVHEPGAATAAEQDSVGDVRHPHPAIRGVGQEHQHLVCRHRQAVLGAHLGVELLHHARMRLEHAAPRGELRGGEG